MSLTVDDIMNYEEVSVVVSDTEKQVVYGIVDVLNKALNNGLDTVAIMDDAADLFVAQIECKVKRRA